MEWTGAGAAVRSRFEIDVVDADIADRRGGRARRIRAAVLAAPAIDKINQTVADAFDRRDVEFHRSALGIEAPRAKIERASVGGGGVVHAKRDGTNGGSMQTREALRERIRLGVDDEIDLTLPIQGDLFVSVPRNGGKSHRFEHVAQRRR